jgi:hypothetical protein
MVSVAIEVISPDKEKVAWRFGRPISDGVFWVAENASKSFGMNGVKIF